MNLPLDQPVELTYIRSEEVKNPWGQGTALKIITEQGYFISTSKEIEYKFISLNIGQGSKFKLTKSKQLSKNGEFTRYEIEKL